MFGGIRVKPVKSTPKKLPSNSRFAFVRIFMDKCYRDPYRWGFIKCVTFFGASIFVAKLLTELDILPSDQAVTKSTPAAY